MWSKLCMRDKKIAKMVRYQHCTAKFFMPNRKLCSLNEFTLTNLRLEIKFVHLLCMLIDYRHKSHQK